MWQYLDLIKAENPEAYKKLAEQGVMVGFPARIKGQAHRADIGIPYHSTVKFFNPEKDHPRDIHAIASKMSLTPPDPKTTRIEPGQFKDRMGNDVYVIKLHGKHADEIKGHNAKFSHMGYPANFEYQPHVSVDKKTWDNIVASKATTAHEAGIDFGPAELRRGHQILATYKPKIAAPLGGEHQSEDKLAASEDMNKSVFRNLAAGAAMTAGLAMAPSANAPIHQPAQYSSQKMLHAIADVESSGGKNENHAAGGGPIHGNEHAFGKYGLMPETIRETIHMNRDLATKHSKAMRLKGTDLNHYMQDNPGLEDQIATKHLSRLEHHFGQNPSTIGYAWLNGVKGTYDAQKHKKDLGSHWHAKKVREAYEKEK
jgi:hypothetical protein